MGKISNIYMLNELRVFKKCKNSTRLEVFCWISHFTLCREVWDNLRFSIS